MQRPRGERADGQGGYENSSALAGVTQWIQHRPANQRVDSSIPSQGTCLGCGPGSQGGLAATS